MQTLKWLYPLRGTSQVALVVKNPTINGGDTRDLCLIPGSGRSPGRGHGNPLQYACLENPMDRSMPGLPVHHQFPKFTQAHIHWVGDAIQPFILCRPLLLLPSIFPSIRVFSNESVLCIRWLKDWNFSFNISPSNEYFRDGLVGSPYSPRDSQESSPIPQFKSINSSVLSFL